MVSSNTVSMFFTVNCVWLRPHQLCTRFVYPGYSSALTRLQSHLRHSAGDMMTPGCIWRLQCSTLTWRQAGLFPMGLQSFLPAVQAHSVTAAESKLDCQLSSNANWIIESKKGSKILHIARYCMCSVYTEQDWSLSADGKNAYELL